MAHGAVLAAAAAARAHHVELHAAALLRDLSFAVALGTLAWALKEALAVAVGADFAAWNGELHLRALDRLPEANVHLVFQIVARCGMLHRLLTAAAEDAGEDVAESATAAFAARCARALGVVIEVEAAEVERNFLGVGARSTPACAASAEATRATAARVGFRRGRVDVVGVEPNLVVDLALLGIAEDVVGLGEGLELLLGRLVDRIHVGVILARQLAKRLTDLLRRGSLLHPENAVIVFVFVGRGWHGWLSAVSFQLELSVIAFRSSLLAFRQILFSHCHPE